MKSQHEYNQISIDRRGLKKIGLIVKKPDIELFQQLRRESGLSVPDFFTSMLTAVQSGKRAPVEPPAKDQVKAIKPVTRRAKAQKGYRDALSGVIDTDMPVKDRRQFCIELLNRHGGDKKAAMKELSDRLKVQYPGFTSNREVNKTGQYAEPQKFYSAVSDFLVGHIKKGK